MGGTVVLGDLAEIGYDAEWRIVSAAGVGAPHRRERIIILAYPQNLFGDGGNDNARIGLGSETLPELRDGGGAENVAHADNRRYVYSEVSEESDIRRRGAEGGRLQWEVEPDMGRVANGVPARVDRLRGLGNAVVPQVAEYVGRLVMKHYEHSLKENAS